MAICEETPDQRPPVGFGYRHKCWVIRNEDIDVFGSVKDAIITLAGVQFAFTNLGLAGITALTLAVTRLLQNAHNKGATLEPEQAVVVVALGTAKSPILFSNLMHTMSPQTGLFKWNELELRRVLKSLKTVPALNGSVAFVEEYPDDKWGLKGV